MSHGTVRILDPTVAAPAQLLSAVPRLSTLRGRRLGVRIDRAWQSWTQCAAHVERLARERLRVRDVVIFDPGVRTGTTEEERRKVEGFVRDIDAAIVGLGT